MVITPDFIQRQAHGGMGLAKAQQWANAFQAACDRFAINTPLRVAHFFAQVMHESMGLYYTRELWGPTPAQQGYEGRADLGNTERGDGRRFMGRGPIELTGRGNYRKAGKALGLDLEGHPEQVEQPAIGAMVAGWFWQSHGLNELADQGADRVSAITQIVNGGLTHLAERQARFNVAWALLQQSRHGVVFIDQGGHEVRWNGKPVVYAGQPISDALVANLNLLYPQPGGPWEYAPTLRVWLRRNGDYVLERIQ